MRSLLHSLFVLVVGLALASATPSVTISAGTVHGTTCSNGQSAFLSIPYAEPPTGNLRWTAPQAYNQGYPAGGYNASTKGAACIQFGTQFLETGLTSEDW
jgi:carboxylesterase type B